MGDREGLFQLLACAASPDDALDAFRARLKELRKKYDILDNISAVYLDGLAELPVPLPACVLLDYREIVRRETGSYTIGNTAPEQGLDVLDSYGYGNEGEGENIQPFVQFSARGAPTTPETRRLTRV